MMTIFRIAVLTILASACVSDGMDGSSLSAVPEWHLIEDLRLGSLDAGVPNGFGDQVVVAAADDGTIYVGDNQSSEIRIFAADGRYLRTVGGKGAGPAEFRDLIGLQMGPDETVWAVDRGLGRIVKFDRDGHLLSTTPHQGFVNLPWAGRIDHSGVLHNPITRMDPSGVRQGYQRYQAGTADTLLLPPYELQMHEVVADNTERRSFIVPFSARPQWAMDWDGMLWFGNGSEYRIYRLAYDGDTVAVVEGIARDAPVTQEEADAALSGLRDRLGASAISNGEWFPSHRPAFEDIAVTREDQLWVTVTEADGQRSFDVFDFQGHQMAVARFEGQSPAIDQIVVRNGHVYGIIRNDLDVPYVARYRISR